MITIVCKKTEAKLRADKFFRHSFLYYLNGSLIVIFENENQSVYRLIKLRLHICSEENAILPDIGI